MGTGHRRRQRRKLKRKARRTRSRTPNITKEDPRWIEKLKELNKRILDQRVERIRQEITRREIKDQHAARWAKELSELYAKWRRTDTLDYVTAKRINQLRAKLGQNPQFLKDTLFYLQREGPIRGARGQIRHIVEETLIHTTTYLALAAPIVTIAAIQEQLAEGKEIETYNEGHELYQYGTKIREQADALSDMAAEIRKDQTIPARERAELILMLTGRAEELYELSDEYIGTGFGLMGE